MMINKEAERLLSYGLVALLWLVAGAVGLNIGSDVGHAIFK
jgi:hypothetical protein